MTAVPSSTDAHLPACLWGNIFKTSQSVVYLVKTQEKQGRAHLTFWFNHNFIVAERLLKKQIRDYGKKHCKT
jgi:hypothetical protein